MIDMSPQSSSLLRISLLSIALMTALAWLPRIRVAAPAQCATNQTVASQHAAGQTAANQTDTGPSPLAGRPGGVGYLSDAR